MTAETKDRSAIEAGDSDTNALPEGWATVTLPELVDINPGKPPADHLPADAPVSFVPMPAVDDRLGAITRSATRAFLEVRKGYTAFCDGDVIMAKITPCMENGKAAVAHGLTNGLGFGSTEFHVLRTRGAVLAEYVYHYIRQESFRRTAANEMTGSVGQKRVPRGFLESVRLPLPPLAEQRRIVDLLADVLLKLDSCRDRLERAPSILRRFRRAVLAAAASGELTAGWRTGVDESDVGLGHFLDRTDRASADIPALWSLVPLEEVAECLDNKRRPVNRDERSRRTGNIPYYGANGQVGWIDTFLFDEDLVLVVEDETFIGRTLPFSYVIRGKTWVNNHAHVLRPREGLDAEYLNICLAYYNLVPLTSGTTGRRKLTKGALMKAPILVAPQAERMEIVRRVNALVNLADAIEKRVMIVTSHAHNVRRAVLARAFRGELVPTEAELAAEEGRPYESAAELLRRLNVPETTRASQGKRRVPRQAATRFR